MKKNNKKGFTLAELLIVVAIIAVLTAIAIPVFSGQLDKAKLATATANSRSAVAEYVADCLSTLPEPSEVTDEGVQGALDELDPDKELQGCTAEASDGTVTVTSPKNNVMTFTYKTGDPAGSGS
jgi:prepilin-type N-terminal cleavage/methylation domain-containing protein